jgi:hypothetical protein
MSADVPAKGQAIPGAAQGSESTQSCRSWLGREDSNLGIPESKSYNLRHHEPSGGFGLNLLTLLKELLYPSDHV